MATTAETTTYDEYGDPLGCVDDHMANTARPCSGPVEYHLAPSGSVIARCERHNAERWERYYDSDLERYADSDVAPDWFDPADAGERWDDDY